MAAAGQVDRASTLVAMLEAWRAADVDRQPLRPRPRRRRPVVLAIPAPRRSPESSPA